MSVNLGDKIKNKEKGDRTFFRPKKLKPDFKTWRFIK